MNSLKKLFSPHIVLALAAFALGMIFMWGAQNFRQARRPAPQDLLQEFALDPFQRMEQLQRQMLQVSSPVAMSTDVNVREDDRYVYCEIAVPGLNEKNLKVDVRDGQITVSGRTEQRSQDDAEQSYVSSAFHQSFPVPENADPNKAKILYDKDKVTIQFPKGPVAQNNDQGFFT